MTEDPRRKMRMGACTYLFTAAQAARTTLESAGECPESPLLTAMKGTEAAYKMLWGLMADKNKEKEKDE